MATGVPSAYAPPPVQIGPKSVAVHVHQAEAPSQFAPQSQPSGMPAVAPGGNMAAAGAQAPGQPGFRGPGAGTPNSAVSIALQHALSGVPGAGGVPAPPGQPGMAGAPQGVQPSALGADPAYNAFLASLGLTDADLQNAATLNANSQQNNLQANLNNLGVQNTQADQRNDLAYNGRGLFNSSDRLNAGANIDANYAAKSAAMKDTTAQNIANLYTNLAAQLANGQQQASTNAISSLGTGAANVALQGANPFYSGAGPVTPQAAATPLTTGK